MVWIATALSGVLSAARGENSVTSNTKARVQAVTSCSTRQGSDRGRHQNCTVNGDELRRFRRRSRKGTEPDRVDQTQRGKHRAQPTRHAASKQGYFYAAPRMAADAARRH